MGGVRGGGGGLHRHTSSPFGLTRRSGGGWGEGWGVGLHRHTSSPFGLTRRSGGGWGEGWGWDYTGTRPARLG